MWTIGTSHTFDSFFWKIAKNIYIIKCCCKFHHAQACPLGARGMPWAGGMPPRACLSKNPCPPPYLGGVKSGRGSLPGKFWTQTKTAARLVQLQKKYFLCILESRFQGLKSNMYVHFQVVFKQLIGISSRKWNHQWHKKLTWRSKTLLNPH